MENLTHWKSGFNYKYAGIQDLPNGKDVVLTIKEILDEEVIGNNGKKDVLPILYFVENFKPMVCGKENSRLATQALKTPYREQWEGKQIQIGVSREEWFRKTDDYLRIRKFAPKPHGEDVRPTVETGSAVWNSSIDYLKSGNDLNAIMRKYKLTKEQIKTLQQYEVK